jgi:AraC-like DNA-binding protein
VIEAICRFAHAHLHKPLVLADIAQHFAMSESSLRQQFKRATGQTLGDYIGKTRIHRAAGLMDSSDMQLKQIAQLCGFGSVFAFSRAFKREMGVSPSRYTKSSAPPVNQGAFL